MAKIFPFFDRVGRLKTQIKFFPLLSPTQLKCQNDRKDLSYKMMVEIDLESLGAEFSGYFSGNFSLKCDP